MIDSQRSTSFIYLLKSFTVAYSGAIVGYKKHRANITTVRYQSISTNRYLEEKKHIQKIKHIKTQKHII